MSKNLNKKGIDAELSKTLFNDFERFEMFLMANWKKIIIGALIVVVVISGGYWLVSSAKKARLAASNALAEATTEEQLIEAIETYSSSNAVPLAQLRLAKIYFDAKNYDKAIETLSVIKSNEAEKYIHDTATVLVGYILEKSGDLNKAASEFEQIGNSTSANLDLQAESLYNAGRVYYQLKNYTTAEKLLARVSDMNVPFWGDKAKVLLAEVRSVSTKK